ncbi:DegV family protein [Brevibacillus fluminis]|uniref:DegV family protein n=1 Tax=Brevibacillus fluminis TaxID=511487 RepID=UPI003F8A33DA
MPPIVIVTDSAADIDDAKRAEWGIINVPLKVNLGQETYVDWVTIKPAAFYQKLRETGELATTSQPSPLEFAECFKKIVDEHGPDVQIIALMLSAALSGTYQSALIGKSMLEEAVDITIIDSRKASYLYGYAAVQAARAAKAGKTKQQVLDLIGHMLDTVQVFFLVDTLTYLQKGGRIGKASALIGSLLNIKPILSLDSAGTVFPVDKVRGTKKAIARIVEELQAYAKGEPVVLGIVHADAEAEAAELLEKLKQEFTVTDSFLVELGAVIGAHAGPGTLGFVIAKA